MIVYAIKDKKTKKFYNRASRKLRPLAQNTAFYKTVKEAESEMSSRAGSKQILRKLLVADYCDNNKGRFGTAYEYAEQHEYFEAHKNDYELEIVKVEIKEVKN